MYAFMYACMHACMYVCMYVCIYVCMHACMYVHLHIYIYIYIYIHVCMYIYIYIYIYNTHTIHKLFSLSLSISLSIYKSISLSPSLYIYIYIYTAQTILAQRDVTAPWFSSVRQRGCEVAARRWDRKEDGRLPGPKVFRFPPLAHLPRLHSARELQKDGFTLFGIFNQSKGGVLRGPRQSFGHEARQQRENQRKGEGAGCQPCAETGFGDPGRLPNSERACCSDRRPGVVPGPNGLRGNHFDGPGCYHRACKTSSCCWAPGNPYNPSGHRDLHPRRLGDQHPTCEREWQPTHVAVYEKPLATRSWTS